jgi:sec-independent protein translocase protein TatA
MIGDLLDHPWNLLILAILVLVLFGGRKLPEAARSLGKSMRILKSEVQGLHEDNEAAAAAATVQAAPAQLETPAAPAIAAPDAQAQIDALSKQLAELQQSVKTSDSVQAN